LYGLTRRTCDSSGGDQQAPNIYQENQWPLCLCFTLMSFPDLSISLDMAKLLYTCRKRTTPSWSLLPERQPSRNEWGGSSSFGVLSNLEQSLGPMGNTFMQEAPGILSIVARSPASTLSRSWTSRSVTPTT